MYRIGQELNKYRAYLLYSTKGELKSEVSNSYLNTLWWLLDPLFYMIVYSFVSIIVFRAKQQYYQIYIIIGVIIWSFYNRVLQGSVRLIASNQAVISKVYIPKYIFLLRLIGVNLFKLLISCFWVFSMMIIWRVPFSWRILQIIPYTVVLVLLVFSMGMILMHLGVYVSDTSNILTVVLRFQFYLSGIFYNIKAALPAPIPKIISVINPIYTIIEGVRENVLYGKSSDVLPVLIWSFLSIVLAILGLSIMYKREGEYAKVT